MDPKEFHKKQIYVKRPLHCEEESIIFLQHPISGIQEKEMIVDKNIFKEHFIY